MEVDDQIQCNKFPRTTTPSSRTGSHRHHKMDADEDEEGGDNKRAALTATAVDLSGSGMGRFYGWPSSRIVRVSRASGGKDRHSKVLTSKGLRDRRVRLSVNTAIQFYDLQDRLGYDQPSKAVEWLLKAAAESISELPPMNSPFPDTPRQLSDEKRSSTNGSDELGFESAEVDMDGGGGDPGFCHGAVAKSSACSSNSETSKGSGLSLSRSESRIKARERAKERVAAEKEKEKDSEPCHVASLNNPISQTTSFTELLNGGMNNNNGDGTNGGAVHQNPNAESNFFLKSPRHWSSSPMDYFTSGLLGPPAARSGQMHNPFASVASPLFSGDHHSHEALHHFSFAPDHHLVSVIGGNNNNNNNNNNGGGGGEYNLNFTISSSSSPSSSSASGLAGFNRGTLQSNSSSSLPSSLFPHLHRQRQLPHDASPPSFFIGAAAENHQHQHQFFSGYDPRSLQLCYGDGTLGNNGRKGKGGKN